MSKKIPESLGLPVLGHYFAYKSDRLSMLLTESQSNGDIFKLKVGPKSLVVINSEEGIKRVLHTNFNNYVKKINMDKVFGQSVFTMNGENWKAQRSAIQPIFTPRFIKESVTSFVNLAQTNLETYYNPNEILDINKFFSKVTFDIILECIVGLDCFDDFEKIDHDLRYLLEYLTNQNYRPIKIPHFLDIKRKRFEKSLAEIDNIINKSIEESRKDEASFSLVHILLKTLEDFPQFKENKFFLRDNIFFLMSAGYETTSTALSWIAFHFATNKEWEQKCFNETKDINLESPEAYEFKELPLLEAVIHETLRLYPSGWAFTRNSVEDDIIDGHKIEKDTVVLVSPFITQRNPLIWERASEFYPERWATKTPADFGRFQYFPFGSGPRICTGMQFAMMEMKVMLTTILRNYRFEMTGENPQVDATTTLFSKNGFNIKLVKR